MKKGEIRLVEILGRYIRHRKTDWVQYRLHWYFRFGQLILREFYARSVTWNLILWKKSAKW